MTYKPGDILKERYLINEKLGNGSMGEVYRAEHLTLHRQVAIKLMHVAVAENEKGLARFRREAREVAKLDHPHICQVLDFDMTNAGDFYIVMEYLQGETLRERIDRSGKLKLKNVFRVMHDLLSALEMSHHLGIVHRDVKPDNIMLLCREGRDDYVKLIDFGIAHSANPDDGNGTLTQTGQIYGTPQYLSPEQVMGETVDERSDLYSCGCTLYEMIEGVPPFDADNYILLLNQHLSLAPPHVSPKIELAKELDDVIQKLLQKEPMDRYSSAKEVREILDSIANPSVPSLNTRMSQLASSKAIPLPASRAEIDLSRQHNTAVPSANHANFPASMYVIMGLLIVIIIAMGATIMVLANQLNDMKLDALKNSDLYASPMVTEDQQQRQNNEQSAITKRIVLQRHVNRICSLASDSTLNNDPEIVQAAGFCLKGDYQKSFDIIHSNLAKYENDSLIVRMYLLAGFAIEDFDAIVDALIHLFTLDAYLACNPAVRDIIYSLLEDDEKYDFLYTRLKVLEVPRAAPALGWLTLFTPCNKHQKRWERLLQLYDLMVNDYTPEFLRNAVKVWRPYKATGTCDKRLEQVKHFLDDALSEICANPNKIEDPDYPITRCTVCYTRWNEYVGSEEFRQ